jgi:hypothetical protein
MLELTELFDIKADIYRQIPKEQLCHPTKPDQILSPDECRFSIIGQERGSFIISRLGYSKKVCLNQFGIVRKVEPESSHECSFVFSLLSNH